MTYEYVFNEIAQTLEKKMLMCWSIFKVVWRTEVFLLDSMQRSKGLSYVWLLSRKQLYFFASVLLTQKNEGQ